MSSAMATQQFAANVLRTGARKAGRSAPVRATRMSVRAAASNGGLPIDLRGASLSPRPGVRDGESRARSRESIGTRRDRAIPAVHPRARRPRRPVDRERRLSSERGNRRSNGRAERRLFCFFHASEKIEIHPAGGPRSVATSITPPLLLPPIV
jgi:hypothetical protein